MNDVVLKNMEKKKLSKYASKDSDAIYLKEEITDELRTSYFHDIDRIIYSLAFTRYLDKTQVFTHPSNDHLTRRMTHVQFVSKIARTIGRALNLNEDLIEASALGHDLGHTPFGHVGERVLNEISLKHGEGLFNHNIQSVRLLSSIENHGNGLNVSVQVLDAIMCHNGEFALGEYRYSKKSVDEFWKEYNDSYKDNETLKNMKPMTFEGCVVRISDLIAYLGKDIEDAIKLHIITTEDIPENIKNVLGTKNGEIVNTIVNDIINNSVGKNYIKISDDVFNAIEELKDFNYKNIYKYAYTKKEERTINDIFYKLFDKYLNDLNNNNYESIIYTSFLNNMSSEYKKNTNERIVIDYLAGMTDIYILKQYKLLKEEKINNELY